MIRSFSLTPYEAKLVESGDQERQRLLADIGGIMLQLEGLRKNLESAQDRQRAILASALGRLDIKQFMNARLEGMNLVVELPDQPVSQLPVTGAGPQPVERVNGALPDKP